MHHAFQDRENLYLIMDYLGGGDLRHHIIRNTRFTEEELSKIQIFTNYFNKFRVYYSMYTSFSRIYPLSKYNSS